MTGTAAGDHEETAVHLEFAYIVPIGKKMSAVIFGGPSFFTVKQSVVTAVQRNETYPFDEVTFTGATVATEDESTRASTSAPTSPYSRRTSASAASSASRRRRRRSRSATSTPAAPCVGGGAPRSDGSDESGASSCAAPGGQALPAGRRSARASRSTRPSVFGMCTPASARASARCPPATRRRSVPLDARPNSSTGTRGRRAAAPCVVPFAVMSQNGRGTRKMSPVRSGTRLRSATSAGSSPGAGAARPDRSGTPWRCRRPLDDADDLGHRGGVLLEPGVDAGREVDVGVEDPADVGALPQRALRAASSSMASGFTFTRPASSPWPCGARAAGRRRDPRERHHVAALADRRVEVIEQLADRAIQAQQDVLISYVGPKAWPVVSTSEKLTAR